MSLKRVSAFPRSAGQSRCLARTASQEMQLLKSGDRIIMTTHINDASFEVEVLRAEGLVLVDFWAEWCSSCKKVSPVLDELALARQDDLTIAKINVDDNMSTATQYGVRRIPTLILFRNGEVLSTKIGAVQKHQLVDWINSHS
jgi:thioredoxin 1